MDFGVKALDNVLPTILWNASVLYTPEDAPFVDHIGRYAIRRMEDMRKTQTVVSRRAAITLAEALAAFIERHGDNRFDVVTVKDLQSMVQQPTDTNP